MESGTLEAEPLSNEDAAESGPSTASEEGN
jgi:hypothetical protein